MRGDNEGRTNFGVAVGGERPVAMVVFGLVGGGGRGGGNGACALFFVIGALAWPGEKRPGCCLDKRPGA